MKTLSNRVRVVCLLLSASCLQSAIARADDAGSISPPLLQTSPAARNADEAPHWDAAAQPPRTLPDNVDAQPLSATTTDPVPAPEPRPLQSVMKNRPKTAAADRASGDPASSAVAPARYDAPVAEPAREQIPGSLMPRATGGSTSATATAASNRSEPTTDPAKIAAARATADLLAGAVAELEAESIPRLSLSDALAGAPEQQRLAAVGKYWRLSRAIKDHRWALDELKRLEAVAPNRSAVEGPMLSTARAAAEARVNEAELSVVRARQSLVLSATTAPTIYNSDFITGDRPLLGPYNTYFSAIFANRAPPGRTREIDRALPIRLEALADRTAAVQSAMTAVRAAEEAHAKGEADMRTVLACHEQLHAQRRALLDAVLDYNLDIAEYAASVASPGTPNDKFVAMLIHTRQPERLSQVPTLATDPSATLRGRGGYDPTEFLGIRPNATADGPPRNPTTPQPSARDGWVPSTMHSLEGEPPDTVRAAQPSTTPDGPRTDPFAPERYRQYGQ